MAIQTERGAATLESIRIENAPPIAHTRSTTETHTTQTFAQADPTVALETYIPIDRKNIVARALEKQFETGARPLAAEVVRYMSALRQVESAKTLDKLVELYDPFNPDDETMNLTTLSSVERRLQLEDFRKRVADLAESANYVEIDKEKLEKLLDSKMLGSLPAIVDLDEYDFHLLFYRGQTKIYREQRSWTKLWLGKKSVAYDAYSRLFLALKLKPRDVRLKQFMDEGLSAKRAARRVKRIRKRQMLEGFSETTLHLKIFRQIAADDLKILFPNAEIKFKLYDQMMLWIGSGGSAAFAVASAVLKFVFFVAISPILLIGAIIGAGGAIFRSVMNFFNTRTRYMMRLATSLYFYNLASSQSVLALLNDDAEEEDIKEAVLTYAFLVRHGERGIDEVRFEVEKFLKDEFDVEIRFDIEDGLSHLAAMGLLIDDNKDHPRALELEEAYPHLLRLWQAAPG